jgi:hypothetical protein
VPSTCLDLDELTGTVLLQRSQDRQPIPGARTVRQRSKMLEVSEGCVNLG